MVPVSPHEWHGVVADWLQHGRFTTPHSCAATVLARGSVVPKYHEGMPLVHALDLYERKVCPTGNVWAVAEGMTNRQVASSAGAPVPWLSGPRCWFYRARKAGTSIDGLSFCFASGRVANIIHAVHT